MTVDSREDSMKTIATDGPMQQSCACLLPQIHGYLEGRANTPGDPELCPAQNAIAEGFGGEVRTIPIPPRTSHHPSLPWSFESPSMHGGRPL
jgi:hypothetical protein